MLLEGVSREYVPRSSRDHLSHQGLDTRIQEKAEPRAVGRGGLENSTMFSIVKKPKTSLIIDSYKSCPRSHNFGRGAIGLLYPLAIGFVMTILAGNLTER